MAGDKCGRCGNTVDEISIKCQLCKEFICWECDDRICVSCGGCVYCIEKYAHDTGIDEDMCTSCYYDR